MSNYFTGRGGNQGACAQPCRWEYHIYEKGYEGEYFPAFADDRGTYVFNSKDLCMISHLQDMAAAGITSLKIEGRMKSAYYVGCVVGAYRRALNDLAAGRPFDVSLPGEVAKAGSRAFTTGFYYGNPRESGQDTERSTPQRTYDFTGVVKAERDAHGRILIEQRNKFAVGDVLEVLSPYTSGAFTVDEIIAAETGERRQSAPHPKEMLYIGCPYDVRPGDMLRKKREI